MAATPDDRENDLRQPSSETEALRQPGVPESVEDPLGKVGTVLAGKYHIRAHVKGGGFAEVYQGFNANLPDQRVIIKFLRDHTLGDRFTKEAHLLCRLDHPNICRVIDYLPAEFALIVPFIDGKDCERILRSSGPLPPEMFIKLALTITDALAFAHARKIAHRDIKPGNIMIDRHGIPYLIDFGIAKEIDVDSTSTRTGYVALTPQFAAPERQSGDTGYNPFLSDIYELGVTLCVLTTGELPYRNASYPSLRDWDRTFQKPLSPSLREVLQKASHPTPSERIQTAAELTNLLRQVKMVEAPAKRSKTAWGIAAAVGVVILAFAIWKIANWPEPSPAPTQLTQDESATSNAIPPRTDNATVPGDVQSARDTSIDNAVPPATPQSDQATSAVPSHIRVDVLPREGSIAFIDGDRATLATEHSISAGAHRLRIMNPDYPILERTVRVSGRDTALVYDLAHEFAGRDSVDLRIMLNPPSTDYDLDVVMNGSKRTFASFPTRDLKRQAGRWRIELRLAAHGATAVGQARVDSAVTFPYGGGPRVAIRGGSGELDFGGEAWQGKRTISLQVNWSAIPKR